MTSLVGTRVFLGNYIAKSSGELGLVGEYYLVLYLAQTLTFVVWAKRCKENSFLPLYRLGLLLNVCYFLILGVVQEGLVTYLIPLAFIHGIAQGLFWLPTVEYHIEFSGDKDKGRFFTKLGLTMQGVGILVPITAGWMITRAGGGYASVFYAFAALFAIGFIGSAIFLVRNPGERGKYYFPSVLKVIRGNPEVLKLMGTFFFIGVTIWGTMELFMPLLVYRATGSELALGTIASLFPIIEMGSSIFGGRAKATRRPKIVMVSGALIFCGTLVAAVTLNLGTIIFYAMIFSLSVPSLSVIINTLTAEITRKHSELLHHQTEFIVARELSLGFGRALGYASFFAITHLSTNATPLRAALAFFGCVVLFGPFGFLRHVTGGEAEQSG